jgi:hypothetical protein
MNSVLSLNNESARSIKLKNSSSVTSLALSMRSQVNVPIKELIQSKKEQATNYKERYEKLVK